VNTAKNQLRNSTRIGKKSAGKRKNEGKRGPCWRQKGEANEGNNERNQFLNLGTQNGYKSSQEDIRQKHEVGGVKHEKADRVKRVKKRNVVKKRKSAQRNALSKSRGASGQSGHIV